MISANTMIASTTRMVISTVLSFEEVDEKPCGVRYPVRAIVKHRKMPSRESVLWTTSPPEG
jgi:hypothetical protein